MSRDPSAIAQSIVDRFCEKSGFHRGQWLADKLIEEISQAIQDASQPVAISDAELEELAEAAYRRTRPFELNPSPLPKPSMAAWCYGYLEGFRECARRNAAVVDVDVGEQDDESKIYRNQDGQLAFNAGVAWLKQKVMGEKK